MIDRTTQRFPSEGGVHTIEMREEVVLQRGRKGYSGIVMAARVRDADIQIRGLGDVLVSAQVGDGAYVAALHALEQLVRIAAEELAGGFEENALRPLKGTGDGGAGVVDAILAADQIFSDQRTIGPGQHVIV